MGFEFLMVVWTIVLVFFGVWGTMLLRARLGRLNPDSTGSADERLEAEEERQLLEVRVQLLEEEIAFLRDLRTPTDRELAPPGEGVAPDEIT